jgi:chromosome segregation ATPase
MQENEELELQSQKLRGELTKQKAELSQMVKKTSEPSETTSAETSLPNELLSTLSGLRERLSGMREFYEHSLKDESFEESVMRQIEDERTEKHLEIEKAKEKCAAKVAELRKTYARGQAEMEKNIRLMNAHLDDLKSQNVDLQRELADAPDRRGGTSTADRKNLEESIRLKQNNINSLKSLNGEKDKRINELEFRLASINAQVATLQSYKETFPFILSETLAWVQRKNNKLKHSIKTLSNEDEATIRKIFKEADLNPF